MDPQPLETASESAAPIAAGREHPREGGPLVALLRRLRAGGFSEGFRRAGDRLESLEARRGYAPSEIELCAAHRLQGATDPNEPMAMPEVMRDDRARGLLVETFGPYARLELGELPTGVPRSRLPA